MDTKIMFSNIVLVVHNYIMYMYMYLYKEPTAVPDTVSHEWHPGITVQCTYTGVSLSFCAGGQWGFSAGHFKFFL